MLVWLADSCYEAHCYGRVSGHMMMFHFLVLPKHHFHEQLQQMKMIPHSLPVGCSEGTKKDKTSEQEEISDWPYTDKPRLMKKSLFKGKQEFS